MSETVHKVVKAGVAGAIAMGGAYLLGETGPSTFLGMQMSAPAAEFAANATASFGADMAHDYVYPYIPLSDQFKNATSAALGLAISGGGAAILQGHMPSDPSFIPNVALGGVSYYGANKLSGSVIGLISGEAPNVHDYY